MNTKSTINGIRHFFLAAAFAFVAAAPALADPDLMRENRFKVFEKEEQCADFYMRVIKDWGSPSDTLFTAFVSNPCFNDIDREGTLKLKVDGQLVGTAYIDGIDNAVLYVVVDKPMSSLVNAVLVLEGHQVEPVAPHLPGLGFPERLATPTLFHVEFPVDLR